MDLEIAQSIVQDPESDQLSWTVTWSPPVGRRDRSVFLSKCELDALSAGFANQSPSFGIVYSQDATKEYL